MKSHEKCSAFGCNLPTQRAAGKGYSETYCRKHVDFKRRHGSSWRKSLTAPQLKPFMERARRWLKHNASDHRVDLGLKAIENLLATAGSAETAYNLRGLSATKRSRVALARLRDASIPPEEILKRSLAVITCCEEEEIADPEYRRVQLAKAVHRLASGTDISNDYWKFPRKYPRPEGRIMRILGAWLEDIALVVKDHRIIQ